MRKIMSVSYGLIVICVFLSGCSDDGDKSDDAFDNGWYDGGMSDAASDSDSDMDTDSDSDGDAGSDGGQTDRKFDAVDILIMLDNSSSMGEEQAILATQFFNLINALINPVSDDICEAADNVRIGMVSSDMGLQYGDNGNLPGSKYQDMFSCGGRGDNGKFQTYDSSATIDIQPGAVRCKEDAAQCPTGWTCENMDNMGIGTCEPAQGDGKDQACPSITGSYLETESGEQNPLVSFQVSCMANLGIEGCGFEQQLKAVDVGLTSNGSFIRDDALLAVIVISDEEDCSIMVEDLFDEDELNDVSRPNHVNVACGRHEDHLYGADHYRDAFIAAKDGDSDAVVFAALVGVPISEDCEGRGNEIVNCLDHEKMQNVEVLEQNSQGVDNYVFAPACERFDSNNDLVTKARPGRRYVALARRFGERGFVSSICNEDWESIMLEIARLINCAIALE